MRKPWPFLAVLGALVCAGALAEPSAQTDSSIARAQKFVGSFEAEYVRLVARETYTQRVAHPQGGPHRSITSEVAAARLDATSGFVFLRSVVNVDGHQVNDSERRLDALLASGSAPDRQRILAFRDEGSRFNVGTIHRNLNDPTLALRFLLPDVAPRFSFDDKGEQLLNGVRLRRVTYRETARPTLIRDGNLNVPASGTIWMTTDGVVQLTELEAAFLTAPPASESGYLNLRTVAHITVEFKRDDRLAVWVPLRMREEYRKESDALGPDGTPSRTRLWEHVEGDARYEDFRRFETSGRVLP